MRSTTVCRANKSERMKQNVQREQTQHYHMKLLSDLSPTDMADRNRKEKREIDGNAL